MDTSEQYIRQVDCPEIQGRWEISGGDFYTFRYKLGVGIARFSEQLDKRECIWLPRQDDLQKMLLKPICNGNLWLIDKFADGLDGIIPTEDASMEQLWLAFVMKALHSKTWEKDKWVKV